MIPKNFTLILIIGVLFTANLNAQLKLGDNPTSINSSALLEMESTGKGFLPVRMTAAQRGAISSPATGLLVYQTDGTSGFYYYNGSSWVRLDAGITSSQWTTSGSDIFYIAGNVGIGVTSPSSALQVSGSVRFQSLSAGILKSDGSGNLSSATLSTSEIPDLDAAKITTGTFADARIPNLAASKITSGTFDAARIPNLNTSILNAGTLGIARGGTGIGSTPSNGQLLIGNGTNYSLATLTGTTNRVTVTNGAGTITLSGPQDIHTGASPTFSGLSITNNATVGGTLGVSGVTTTVGLSSTAASGASNLLSRTGGGANWFPFTDGNNYISSDLTRVRTAANATIADFTSSRLTVSGGVRAARGQGTDNSSNNGFTIADDGDTGMFGFNGTSSDHNVLTLNLNAAQRVWVRSGDCNTAFAFTVSSDQRIKKNIQKLTPPLQKLMSLNAYSYNFNNENPFGLNMGDPDRKSIGFIAQEIEKVFPELVNTQENGMKGVQYELFSAILLEAIKEQQEQIEILQSEKAVLSNKLSTIASEVNELKEIVKLIQPKASR